MGLKTVRELSKLHGIKEYEAHNIINWSNGKIKKQYFKNLVLIERDEFEPCVAEWRKNKELRQTCNKAVKENTVNKPDSFLKARSVLLEAGCKSNDANRELTKLGIVPFKHRFPDRKQPQIAIKAEDALKVFDKFANRKTVEQLDEYAFEAIRFLQQFYRKELENKKLVIDLNNALLRQEDDEYITLYGELGQVMIRRGETK